MSIGNRGPALRPSGRRPDELRPVTMTLGVQKWAEGSCRIRVGDTEVLCAATIEDRVPPHLRGKGSGWVTAEYSMLPRSTAERTMREATAGKIGGRTHEIQRLIGRSLRGVVDLGRLGERTVTVDCDVLQADGGTRTASITGGYVALAAALITYGMERLLVGKVAAVSVGIHDGVPLLDLDYAEDKVAEVDFNVVGTDAGHYVELQGTAEGKPFSRDDLGLLLDLAGTGLATLFAAQARDAGHREAVTDPPRLLVATRSRHKLAELRDLLRLGHAELVDLDDVAIADEVEETGSTFAANAAIKARYYARRSGLPTLADDSGLEVDALGGGPGVRTRRYAGEQATDAENNAKLLAALAGLPPGAAGRALPLRAGPRAARARGPARRAARHADAGHLRGSHRDRAPRRQRLRLRPHLRAGLGTARRRDRRGVADGAQAGRLASRPRRPAHGPAPGARGVLSAIGLHSGAIARPSTPPRHRRRQGAPPSS